MDLFNQARGFLESLGNQVHVKDPTLLISERPGLGAEIDRKCVWVLTRELRKDRNPISLEEEFFNRFKGAAKKYPGARLHLLTDSLEDFTGEFRAKAHREYHVLVQVPCWFFDIPFSWETSKTAASASKELNEEASRCDAKRVPQQYSFNGTDRTGKDIVPELFQEIEDHLSLPDPRIWFVIAPAGHGKSVFFSSLFGRLYRKFQEAKKAQIAFPRPLPMFSTHLREATGANVQGLIDAFIRTEFVAPANRKYLNWLVDNRFGFLMFDGLDEVITRDPEFINYLEDRLTSPASLPFILICLRDSLFQSNDEISEFVKYYQANIKILELKSWDHAELRNHAWIHFQGRRPQPGDMDPTQIVQYLNLIEKNAALKKLASTPFYSDLLIKTISSSGGDTPLNDIDVVDRAVMEMCRREYSKRMLKEEIIPIASFREWLEELAALNYQTNGLSIEDLRQYASLAPVFVSRQLNEQEEKELIENIIMGPFFTKSAISGRLEITHEILAEFLAAFQFMKEFRYNPSQFSARLSQRFWPPDSLLFSVIGNELKDNLEKLLFIAESETLSSEGFRNFIQLLALISGGEAILRSKRISLEGAKLHSLRFVGLNLDNVPFRGADLTNAQFDGCLLRNAHFEGAVLRRTGFLRIPDDGLNGAEFGDCEHFESVIISDSRWIEDTEKFQKWLHTQTGREKPILGPCPTARQVLFLFRKFIEVDGQGRRTILDKRGVLRGREEQNAPSKEDCLTACLQYGYFIEEGPHKQIRRATGPSYGEMVAFVKNQQLSPNLKLLLDSLCRIKSCGHVFRVE